MAKFVVVYTGGAMAESPEAQEAVMQKWMGWFGSLGSAVLDFGNPFGGSAAIGSDGSTRPATASLTGYSILEADSIEAASKLASGCPVLEAGGGLEIYEALPM